MTVRTSRLALLVAISISLPCFARAAGEPEVEIPFPADIPIPPATVLTPEEMLKTFKVPPGFHVELVACEPMITTPVAMQFDEDGRLWVVEMNGYMPNIDGKNEDVPNGRVVVLEDTDGDGKMDKRTVFLDKLVMPRAIMLRKGGALVCEPPVVYWCADANHDLVADGKEPLIPNYATGGNPEHMPNGLMLALDGWIYNAKSSWRYHFAQSSELRKEATLFRGQWGISQDDYGRIYYNTNSDQLRADLLPSAYLARNPNFKNAEGVNVQIAKSQRTFPGRVNPGVNRGYRKGELDEQGRLRQFTAVCGPVVYRGDLFPAEFYGNVFVAEPAGNLIKRDVLTETGGSIEAKDAAGKYALPDRDFLTSTSERFRPVNLYNGPDGALYVTDIARGVVQHITYVTPWLRRQFIERKLEQPLDQGRIWRIVPDGAKRPSPVKLSAHTSEQLVADLGSANGWVRETAQRLIVERGGEAAVPALKKLASSAKQPASRIAALWTLAGLEKLDAATAVTSLTDPEAKVRATAVRLAEPFAKRDTPLAEKIFALATDKAADVRLQLLLTLGEIATPKADAIMADVLNADIENSLARSAAISGLRGRELEFLRRAIQSPSWSADSKGRQTVLSQLARCVLEERKPARVSALLDEAAKPTQAAWQQLTVLDAIGSPSKSFKRVKFDAEPAAIAALANSTDAAVKSRAPKIAAVLTWPGKPGEKPEPKAPPLTDEQKEFVAKGAATYATICAACHLPQGQGQEGLAPPLAGSDWVDGPESRLMRIVLNGVGGPITVAEKEYTLDMPGLGAVLNDEQIAQVLSYVRRSFGHEQPVIDTASVTKTRAGNKDRGSEWTAAELEKVQ
jgi:mono/diheme cytochrome c family protein/glucose/arabinose dehydrogenase